MSKKATEAARALARRRMATLTKERRSEIARNAARKRWEKRDASNPKERRSKHE